MNLEKDNRFGHIYHNLKNKTLPKKEVAEIMLGEEGTSNYKSIKTHINHILRDAPLSNSYVNYILPAILESLSSKVILGSYYVPYEYYIKEAILGNSILFSNHQLEDIINRLDYDLFHFNPKMLFPLIANRELSFKSLESLIKITKSEYNRAFFRYYFYMNTTSPEEEDKLLEKIAYEIENAGFTFEKYYLPISFGNLTDKFISRYLKMKAFGKGVPFLYVNNLGRYSFQNTVLNEELLVPLCSLLEEQNSNVNGSVSYRPLPSPVYYFLRTHKEFKTEYLEKNIEDVIDFDRLFEAFYLYNVTPISDYIVLTGLFGEDEDFLEEYSEKFYEDCQGILYDDTLDILSVSSRAVLKNYRAKNIKYIDVIDSYL